MVYFRVFPVENNIIYQASILGPLFFFSIGKQFFLRKLFSRA